MRHIFIDESGCISFGPGGTAFFVLAFVSTEDGKGLSHCIKKFNGNLISKGWPKGMEIKASNLWHAPNNNAIPQSYAYKNQRDVPIEFILGELAKLDIHIEYAAVKLDTVEAGIRNAPYGILYNYFSWQVLKRPLCYFPAIDLYVDRRNRETHEYLKFDGYIEGKTAEERADKGKPAIQLSFYHYHSDEPKQCKPDQKDRAIFGVRGLEAADLVCWAVKCRYENREPKWHALIQDRIISVQHLYFDEKEFLAKK